MRRQEGPAEPRVRRHGFVLTPHEGQNIAPGRNGVPQFLQNLPGALVGVAEAPEGAGGGSLAGAATFAGIVPVTGTFVGGESVADTGAAGAAGAAEETAGAGSSANA